MAYIDQRTGGNRRVAAITVVALIQGAAIVALVNGLAIEWTRQPAPPPLAGEQIDLPPAPKPIPPPPKPPVDQRTRTDDPVLRLPLPGGTVRDPVPLPPPDPLPIEVYDPPPPLPPPTPALTPRVAKPRNAPSGWATTNDYPTRDIREGNQGIVGFTLQIGADGRVQSCAVTRSSLFPGLDKATCDNVSRRARFEPATDGSGNRVPGIYSGTIRWQIPRE